MAPLAAVDCASAGAETSSDKNAKSNMRGMME
jgi:hypothetical protein